MASDRPLMTITEAANQLDCSQTSVRRWIRRGRIRVVRLPSGRMRVYREDVEAILGGEFNKPVEVAS